MIKPFYLGDNGEIPFCAYHTKDQLIEDFGCRPTQIHVIEAEPIFKLLDDVENTIQRRINSDEACNYPFDENLGELLNKIKEVRNV